MIGKRIHPEESVGILGIARSMPDQKQSDEIEKRFLFGIIDLESFKPQRNSIEQLLIGDANSHQGGIYGTYVTTHRISGRTLAQFQKVCRPVFIGEGVQEFEGRSSGVAGVQELQNGGTDRRVGR